MDGLLKRILEDLQKPAARPEDFSGTVKRVLEEAQAQAAELKFADAAQVLDAALAQTEAEDRDRARGRAALLAERGRMARLLWRYREAAEFYRKAADAMAFDPAAVWGHMLDAASALYAQGDEFGDNEALFDAIRTYRSAVDMAPRERVPLQWATSTGNQGVAMMRVAERKKDPVMFGTALRQIGAAFDVARAGGHAPMLPITERAWPRPTRSSTG